MFFPVTNLFCGYIVIKHAFVFFCNRYMKYIYPFECEKYGFSTPSELQAAIDGNRREGRRPVYGYDMASPGTLPPFYR